VHDLGYLKEVTQMSKCFQLYQHPCLGMIADMLTWVASLFFYIIIANYPLKLTPGSQSTVFITKSIVCVERVEQENE